VSAGGSANTRHEGLEIEALRTDRYLETLLATRSRGGRLSATDAALDPIVKRTTDRLARELVRVHPSFRFEERLAGVLAAAARGGRLPAAPGADHQVLAFSTERSAGGASGPVLVVDAGASNRGRPLLIGGAMASAALSIAGAAWVAWRLARPAAPSDAWAKAVRAARAARTVPPVLRAARLPRLD
jgi:hypothetical protein